MLLERKDGMLRFVTSCFVVVMLLMQASTIVFMAFGKAKGTRFWPIIDYPMYAGAHNEGDYINVYYILEVVMKDGTVSKVTADDVGLNFWKFYYIGNDLKKTHKPETARASADLLVALHPNGESIAEVRVYTSPYIITKEGKSTVPPKLLNKVIF